MHINHRDDLPPEPMRPHRPSGGPPSLRPQNSDGLPASGTNVQPQQVGVPRRFSITVVWVYMALSAVLFSALKSLGADQTFSMFFAGYLLTLALSQALLFQGRDPRKASIVGGLIFGVAIISPALLYMAPPREHSMVLFCACPALVCLSTFGGYLLGAMIAGIFLFIRPLGRESTHNSTDGRLENRT